MTTCVCGSAKRGRDALAARIEENVLSWILKIQINWDRITIEILVVGMESNLSVKTKRNIMLGETWDFLYLKNCKREGDKSELLSVVYVQ